MSSYVFTGAYQTNVELPDGTVRLTDPGEAVEFPDFPGGVDTPNPGPLWAGSRTNVAKAAVAAAVAPVVAADPAPVAPVAPVAPATPEPAPVTPTPAAPEPAPASPPAA